MRAMSEVKLKTFSFRLEEQGGKHFREGSISAASKKQAEEILKEREQQYVEFVLTPEREAELEEVGNRATLKGERAIHSQVKPYELVKLSEKK
jgi:hypothetical protein